MARVFKIVQTQHAYTSKVGTQKVCSKIGFRSKRQQGVVKGRKAGCGVPRGHLTSKSAWWLSRKNFSMPSAAAAEHCSPAQLPDSWSRPGVCQPIAQRKHSSQNGEQLLRAAKCPCLHTSCQYSPTLYVDENCNARGHHSASPWCAQASTWREEANEQHWLERIAVQALADATAPEQFAS